MSSFVSRGAVLASARLLNQALALLSPLLLVRLLDIVDYGRYRQFMALAILITSLGGFALAANLTYLLARSPERAAADVTKTCALMFVVALVSALVVVLGRHWLVPAEIADSWRLLALYVFMFLNLEVVVPYWLAQRRSRIQAALSRPLGRIFLAGDYLEFPEMEAAAATGLEAATEIRRRLGLV